MLICLTMIIFFLFLISSDFCFMYLCFFVVWCLMVYEVYLLCELYLLSLNNSSLLFHLKIINKFNFKILFLRKQMIHKTSGPHQLERLPKPLKTKGTCGNKKRKRPIVRRQSGYISQKELDALLQIKEQNLKLLFAILGQTCLIVLRISLHPFWYQKTKTSFPKNRLATFSRSSLSVAAEKSL